MEHRQGTVPQSVDGYAVRSWKGGRLRQNKTGERRERDKEKDEKGDPQDMEGELGSCGQQNANQ